MFIVSVPTMVSNYRKNPRIAVEDYRILVASIWEILGIGMSFHDTKQSLAALINSDDELCQPQADATDKLDLKSELDFRKLNELSPVDSIRRFREVIEYCCVGKDAELFSRVGLADLDQLFERMVNRTSTDDWALHESIRAVERNLERFATGVDVEQFNVPENPPVCGNPLASGNPNGSGDVTDAEQLLKDTDPEAEPYRDGNQWCDVKYARTLGISSQHIDRAKQDGCYEIRLTDRRKADAIGKPYVYRRAELNELSGAIPDKFKVEPK